MKKAIFCFLLVIFLIFGVHAGKAESIITIEPNDSGNAKWTMEKHIPQTKTELIEWKLVIDSGGEISKYKNVKEFIDSINNFTRTAQSFSTRPMKIEPFKISYDINGSGGFGIVRYSFLWINFSRPDGGKISIGDAFPEGFALSSDSILEINIPASYEFKSASPGFDRRDGNMLIWDGSVNHRFGKGEPSIVLQRKSDNSPGSSNGGNGGKPDVPPELLVFLVILVAAGAVIFWIKKHPRNNDEAKMQNMQKDGEETKISEIVHVNESKTSDTVHINETTNETVILRTDSKYIQAGTLLKGKYKIVRFVKSGGMGFVYEAKYDGHKCIIKEAKTGEGIKETKYFSDKLKIEAQILSKIKHKNIVRYIDSFEELNSSFLVEEFVEGDKVGDKYYNNPGREDEVIMYTLQLLNAVQYLHKNQIKHRDINPNNLILTPEKKMVLIDFGTAKYLNIGRKVTQEGPKSQIAATPYYAPPEQWEGDTSEVSDIFSVGRTMYFMLTGEHPTTNPYRRLDFLGKNVTKEMADFVMKATEPEVKERYESADQMINLLNRIKDNVGKTEMNTKVIT